MRIGMVAWSFYPRIGGSVTTVMHLSKALIDKNIKVHIIAPLLKKDIKRIKNLDIDKRIKIHWVISSFAKSYTDYYSRLIFFLKMNLKIKSLSRHIDIFHTHDFNIGLLSAILGTKKPVVSVFGADPLYEILNYKKKTCLHYHAFLENKTTTSLQRIIKITISLFSRNRLRVISLNKELDKIIRKYCTAPIIDIPAGIDIELYRNSESGQGKAEDVILFISRFMSWKGLDMAIDVFKEVKKGRTNARMICIGNGPLNRYYFTKYSQIQGITFIVDLDHRGIIDYYKKASVLLITSQYETFGITILEAMASGLPVVASDLEVFRDRIQDNLTGYLVKDGDVNSYCSRIEEVFGNKKKRQEIINNALEKVKAYSIDKISNEYIKLYYELYKGLSNEMPGIF